MQSLLTSLPEENGTPDSSGTALASLHKVSCFAVPFRADIRPIFHAYSVYGNANATMRPGMTAVTDELGRPLRGGLLHFLRLCLIANNTN